MYTYQTAAFNISCSTSLPTATFIEGLICLGEEPAVRRMCLLSSQLLELGKNQLRSEMMLITLVMVRSDHSKSRLLLSVTLTL